MESKEFARRGREKQPVLAICYDFDKTLSSDDMQAQGYIQSLQYEVDSFWKESNELARRNDMDQNLAYMYKMVHEAEGRIIVTRQKLQQYGAGVRLFDGVDTWFQRIRDYGRQKGVIVEHYIISSGLKEMIEGTRVVHEFEKIYANSFYYNDRGVAVWPAQVINYTNKTQFLFRISKGVLEYNDPGVNEYFSPDEIRVPFQNIAYIGDSDTDIPCMKLVNSRGGHSIGVFDAQTMDKTKVYKMMHDKRVNYFVPADYRAGSALDKLIKSIIDYTGTYDVLKQVSFACMEETQRAEKSQSDIQRRKTKCIMHLESSDSFASTHTSIKELAQFAEWTPEERTRLVQIGLHNKQVSYILSDADVAAFYQQLIGIACNAAEQKLLARIKS